MSTDRTLADHVDTSLAHGGHRTWGYTIYRCTYVDDGEWDTLLQRLRSKLEESLGGFNRMDLMSSFDMKVFDDRALFDGASTATIRDHFTAWARKATWKEQGTVEYRSPRYKFCIQVGAEELHSVLADRSDEDEHGYVRLVWRHFVPEEQGREGWIKARYDTVLLKDYVYFRFIDTVQGGYHLV